MSTSWIADYLALTGLIARRRKALKMTQAQAARVIGLCDRSYRAFENGYGDIPSQSLFRLCAEMGIRVAHERQNSSGREGVAS